MWFGPTRSQYSVFPLLNDLSGTVYHAAHCERCAPNSVSASRAEERGAGDGVTLPQAYRYVLLPNAYRVIVPPMTSETSEHGEKLRLLPQPSARWIWRRRQVNCWITRRTHGNRFTADTLAYVLINAVIMLLVMSTV